MKLSLLGTGVGLFSVLIVIADVFLNNANNTIEPIHYALLITLILPLVCSSLVALSTKRLNLLPAFMFITISITFNLIVPSNDTTSSLTPQLLLLLHLTLLNNNNSPTSTLKSSIGLCIYTATFYYASMAKDANNDNFVNNKSTIYYATLAFILALLVSISQYKRYKNSNSSQTYSSKIPPYYQEKQRRFTCTSNFTVRTESSASSLDTIIDINPLTKTASPVTTTTTTTTTTIESTIVEDPAKANSLLNSKLDKTSFPIFEFASVTRNRPLYHLMNHICVKSGLLQRLNLDEQKFLDFVFNIESGYHQTLTFHNSTHAADVLHYVYILTNHSSVQHLFEDFDKFCLYVAACIHDFDHPGFSNVFMSKIGHPLAHTYNDISILENHHLSSALAVLRRPECNFFVKGGGSNDNNNTSGESLIPVDFKKRIVELVLATDLALHGSILDEFKSFGGEVESTSQRQRLIFYKMIMKCADVSNPVKDFDSIYSKWIQAIMTEFFTQGDVEKEANLPISPYCNRNEDSTIMRAKCQDGFIGFIVEPMFKLLGRHIIEIQGSGGGGGGDLVTLQRNKDRFRSLIGGGGGSGSDDDGSTNSGSTGSTKV